MGQSNRKRWLLYVVIFSVGFFFLGMLCEGLGKNTKYVGEVEAVASSSATIKSDCEQHFLDWVVDDWQAKHELVARDLWGQAKRLDEQFGSNFRLRRMVAEFLKQMRGTRVSSLQSE